MNDAKVKKQIVEKIKESTNVLVALNAGPSVDELSAALGITLAINKINKHATTVFSGIIPPAIDFLEPQKTFENTVTGLQDFIIALDKEKADHLRYKVDGDMVKIFITPYRTTIDESDLEFSQGDYNVDFVLAIGVQNEDNLDAALASHGRILQDATVASVNLGEGSGLGSLNWGDKNASSYSELLASLVKDLGPGKELLDEQIATALLTGIVAATDRFSNAKTSSRVMTIAAELMAAGANQQLIALQLEKAEEITAPEAPQPEQSERMQADQLTDIPKMAEPPEQEPIRNDGELSIKHEFKGDVDEVAEQVAEVRQEEAAKQAEQALSEQLGPNIPTYTLPTVNPELAKAVDYEETPRRTPPGVTGHGNSMAEPSFGGTLNATAEEAAEQKRREEESDRNRTILSHDGSGYIDDKPSYQAPINAAIAGQTGAEPEVRDIFADSPNDHSDSVKEEPALAKLPPLPSVQPPTVAPAQAPFMAEPPHEPTLAEIDAQNRSHADVLNDVHAAFEGQPAQVNPLADGSFPPLPPNPPMPDFSTLPPLPTATPLTPDLMPGTTYSDSYIPAEPLGATLPPAAEDSLQAASDPGQFKIPGMQ